MNKSGNNTHSKKELKHLCFEGVHESALSTEGNNMFIFSIAGNPVKQIYKPKEREVWLMRTELLPHPVTGQAVQMTKTTLMGKTNAELSMEEFEVTAKMVFMQNLTANGGVSEKYINDKKKFGSV
jgi:hypothetical protein